MPGVGVAPLGSGPRLAGIPGVGVPPGCIGLGFMPSGIFDVSIRFAELAGAVEFAAVLEAFGVDAPEPQPIEIAAKVIAAPKMNEFRISIYF